MKIDIREMDNNTLDLINQCDASFTVDSKLLLSAKDGRVTYAVVNVVPYIKQYDTDEMDYKTFISNPDKTVFFAYADHNLAGQIRVMKYWNGYAYIDDVAVDSKYRRQGIGRLLIEHAIEWAREKGFPGLMLETQNNNVGACKLYESCGFELRGFDTHLYKGLNPNTDEIALYWYLIF